jgi:BCCT family betaine/carnitine transporter
VIKTDKIIFYASLVALVSCIAPIIIWSQDSYQILLSLKVSIENAFGSTYQILTIAVLLFVLWLAFSKYGKIQLGEGQYQFDTFSWASMLFCAGVVTGILYWGTRFFV